MRTEPDILPIRNVISYPHSHHFFLQRRSGLLQGESDLGETTDQRQIGNELTDFYVAASAVVTARLAFTHW